MKKNIREELFTLLLMANSGQAKEAMTILKMRYAKQFIEELTLAEKFKVFKILEEKIGSPSLVEFSIFLDELKEATKTAA